MNIASESEILLPFVCFYDRFEDENEGLAIANSTSSGLAGNDLHRSTQQQ